MQTVSSSSGWMRSVVRVIDAALAVRWMTDGLVDIEAFRETGRDSRMAGDRYRETFGGLRSGVCRPPGTWNSTSLASDELR
jgi:hypothetical protein